MRRKKRSFFGLLFKFSLFILLILSVFAMLGQKNAFTGVEYKISMLEKKKMELIKERKYVIAEKAKLSSIENIKKVAVNPEEFQFPDRKKVVYVKTVKQPETHTVSYQLSSQSSAK